jgi:hypothetical protein
MTGSVQQTLRPARELFDSIKWLNAEQLPVDARPSCAVAG